MKNTEDTEEDMDTGEVTHEADSSNLELEEEKTTVTPAAKKKGARTVVKVNKNTNVRSHPYIP